MKKILIYLFTFLFIFTGCEKPDEDNISVPIETEYSKNHVFNSDKDIRQPREGEWVGDLYYTIPGGFYGNTDSIIEYVIKNKSQIFHYIDSSSIDNKLDISEIDLIWRYGTYDPIGNLWSNTNDTIKNINGKFNLDITMYNIAECGGHIQTSYMKFTGNCEVINDTIYESGILEYTLYIDNNLTSHKFGEWNSKLTFLRKRHF